MTTKLCACLNMTPLLSRHPLACCASSFPRSPPGVSNNLQSELEKKAPCRARRKEQKMSRVLRIGLHFPSTPAEEEYFCFRLLCGCSAGVSGWCLGMIPSRSMFCGRLSCWGLIFCMNQWSLRQILSSCQ